MRSCPLGGNVLELPLDGGRIVHWALSGGFQCAMLFCLGNGLRGTEESGEVIGGGSSNAVSLWL